MIQNTSVDILRAFADHFCRKFEPIPMGRQKMERLVPRGMRAITPEYKEALMAPITEQELWTAISKGKVNKAPGPDGICLKFYKMAWNTIKQDFLKIINNMFQEGRIERQQLQGLIVCLPKNIPPRRIEDYRPITLLNADYKILSRIIANRLLPCLPTIIQPGQHCGIRGRSIFDTVAMVREVIAFAETEKKPICVESLDFSAAFDNVTHTYMEEAIRAHGFDRKFTEYTMNLYSNASSEVQINGFRSNLIPIRRSIRQGWPLSMALYALCLNPFLQELDDGLKGINTGGSILRATVIAYADDVTIFLSEPEDIIELQRIIVTYENIAGAKINTLKSKALVLGGWDETTQILDIPYTSEMKILGFTFTNRVNVAARKSWLKVTARVRSIAQEVYPREMNLAMRINFVHLYMLVRIWYTAQIFPPPADSIHQLNTAIAWFIWRGDIFRVPLSTLQRGREEGGWDLINIWAKCRTLFINTVQSHCEQKVTFTALWMRKWDIQPRTENPPYYAQVTAKLGYLRSYLLENAYMPTRGETEGMKSY